MISFEEKIEIASSSSHVNMSVRYKDPTGTPLPLHFFFVHDVQYCSNTTIVYKYLDKEVKTLFAETAPRMVQTTNYGGC